MSDTTGILDNTTSTTRSLTIPGTFKNSDTDTSYSVGIGDTDDFFKIQLSQRSSLNLNLLLPTGGDADLELWDNSAALYTSVNTGSLSEGFITDQLDAGTYYIRVSTNNTSITTNYTLSVNTASTSRADLVWRNYASGSNVIWNMNGTTIVGSSALPAVSDPNWRLEGTGDFNGDGQADLVWRHYALGANSVWFMNGSSIIGGKALPAIPDPNWHIEGIADFDGDGKNDLLWRHYATGSNSVWFMDGTEVKGGSALTSVDLSWALAGTGDFNKDGKPDLVWHHPSSGAVSIWLMNGSTVTGAIGLPPDQYVPSPWKLVDVADFNGDNSPDFLWRNTSGGANSVWFMQGSTVIGGVNVYPVSDLSWDIAGVIKTPQQVDLAGGTLGTAFNAGILTGGTGQYQDTVGTGSDVDDYYKFELTSGSDVTVVLSGLTADATLSLVQDQDSNGVINKDSEIIVQPIASVNGVAQIVNQALGIVPNGIYFVKVSSNSSTKTPYTLQLSSQTTKPIDLQVGSTYNLKTSSNGNLPSPVNIGTNPYQVRVNYSINNALSNAAGPFTVSFYLSRDNVITTSDRQLTLADGTSSDVIIASLAGNGSTSGSQTVLLPNADDSFWGGNGLYYIGMMIDSQNSVVETNENNNTIAATVNITGTKRPDLVGSTYKIGGTTKTFKVETTTALNPGQTVRVTGAVKNQGTVGTTGSFKVTFYLSQDDFLNPAIDLSIGAGIFQTVASKATVSFDSSNATDTNKPIFTSPLQLPPSNWEGWRGNGRYYILMWIDKFGDAETGDSKENNLNYGRVIGQFIDYNYFEVAGL